ncbi:MAG: hypothetical protein ACP5TL_02575 [Candidatus Micrarchaeia archaeon]
MFTYMLVLCLSIISLGLAGAASSRHFIIMVVSIELILLGSSLLAVTMFYYTIEGNIILLLMAIWSIMSLEVIAAVVLYRYMERAKMSLDVTKLSNQRD